MAYIALYRKWRPQGFDSLVGQEPIRRTLKNSVAAGRISHAYLFTGPRGTGKTSTAKILAKALNCQNRRSDGEPCGICSNCLGIQDGSSMDVLEIDAASNRGIDQIRDLREAVKFAPTEGAYKVYIIDEVHMVTTDAFNAFLKTLEEPPSHVVFILATTEPQKIPATILSRCQRYDFRRISVQEIISRLEEVIAGSDFNAEASALRLIAARAGGGLRDALSILDQAAAMSNGAVTEELVRDLLGLAGQDAMSVLIESFLEKNMGQSLGQIERLRQSGQEARQMMEQLVEYLRYIVLAYSAPEWVKEQLTEGEWNIIEKFSQRGTERQFAKWLEVFLQENSKLRAGADGRLQLEMAIGKIQSNSNNFSNLETLMQKIEKLEERIRQLESGKESINLSPLPEKDRVKNEKSPVQAAPDENSNLLPKKNHFEASPPKAAPKQETAKSSVNEPSVALPINKIPEETESMKSGTGESADVFVDEKREKGPLPVEENGGNEEAVWQEVLAKLEARNKRAVKACAEQGQLISLQNNQGHVVFLQSFPMERLLRSDFKTMIENLFEEILGSPFELICSLTEAGLPKKENLKVDEKSNATDSQMALGSSAKSISKDRIASPEPKSEELPKEVQSVLDTLGISDADIFKEE